MITIIFNQVEMNLSQAKKLASNMNDNMRECLESGLIDDARELHTDLVKLDDLIKGAEIYTSIEKLNSGIRYAIKSTDNKGKGITAKKLNNILHAYKNVTGMDMNTAQVKYLRTISDEQASRILYTINVFRKEVA